MTVRRDFIELEEQGVLTKIHGGARSNKAFQYREYSHSEKHIQNKEAKQEIAERAAQLIEDGDTVFLGPGTTVAFLAEAIKISPNSHHKLYACFTILSQKKTEDFQVFLLGRISPSDRIFCGRNYEYKFRKMRFSKIFFSGNGLKGTDVMTSTLAEAYTQNIAIKHSLEKYLLLDASKIGKDDFTSFCDLNDITALVTDMTAKDENYQLLSKHIEIITTKS